MIIGIDGNEANIPNRVGIGNYAYNLLINLFKYRCKSHEFVIYLKSNPSTDLPTADKHWQYKVFGPSKLWTQYALPLRLYLEKPPDVFFSPSHYAPRFCPSPAVISVMDLSFLHYPEMFNKKDLYQLKNWTAYSVKKAKKILTISQFSKEEIIKSYNLEADKIAVTYPGINKEIFNQRKKDNENDFGQYKDFILFVGTLQPRKNILSLIRGFSLITSRMSKVKLLIAGKKGWMYEEIYQIVKQLILEEKVIFLDYVTDEELAHLYRRALCLTLPSFYEGFGIPLIEAMACGCPVVASNVSSIPEITGGAAQLFDPYDINDIASALYEVSMNETKRKNLISKGFIQAGKFNWEQCGRKTMQVFQRFSKIYQTNSGSQPSFSV